MLCQRELVCSENVRLRVHILWKFDSFVALVMSFLSTGK